MIDAAAIDELVDWMIDGARPSASARQIIDGICRRVVGAGVPVGRFALFINTLHPNVVGRRFTWTPEDGVAMRDGSIGLFSREEYIRNLLPTADLEAGQHPSPAEQS